MVGTSIILKTSFFALLPTEYKVMQTKRRWRAVSIIAIEILLINHFLFQFNICGRWRCQQWCNQTNVRRRQPSTHSQTEVHDHGYPEQERRLWSQLQTRKSSCRIRGKRRDQRFNFFKVRTFTMFTPSRHGSNDKSF